MTIAKRLRVAAKTRGLSGNQIARLTGISQPTVARVLSGSITEPSARTLLLIAQAVGLSVSDWQEKDYPLPKESR